MDKSKVSVIVPCFNRAAFLNDALQSVYEQTYKNWECIIVNDGSTDETEKIAIEWSERDERYKYYSKETEGVSSARNYGVDRASGSFIQFLDSDDIIAPNKLEIGMEAVSEMTKEQSSVVVSNFRTFSRTKEETSDPYCTLAGEHLNFRNILVKWSVLSIPIHCGLFDSRLFFDFRFPEDLKAYEDWVMWLNIMNKEPDVFFIDQPLAFYRRHPQSLTRNPQFMDENLKRAMKYVKTFINMEDYSYFSFVEMQKNYKENKRLQRKIEAYEKSRT